MKGGRYLLSAPSITSARSGFEEGLARGIRLAARRIAEREDMHLVVLPTPDPAVVDLWAMRETPRERAIIAEGLARFRDALRVQPELGSRYVAHRRLESVR